MTHPDSGSKGDVIGPSNTDLSRHSLTVNSGSPMQNKLYDNIDNLNK